MNIFWNFLLLIANWWKWFEVRSFLLPFGGKCSEFISFLLLLDGRLYECPSFKLLFGWCLLEFISSLLPNDGILVDLFSIEVLIGGILFDFLCLFDESDCGVWPTFFSGEHFFMYIKTTRIIAPTTIRQTTPIMIQTILSSSIKHKQYL